MTMSFGGIWSVPTTPAHNAVWGELQYTFHTAMQATPKQRELIPYLLNNNNYWNWLLSNIYNNVHGADYNSVNNY